MTYAKVSQLKNRLSAYLKEVRKGGEVTVMDRDNVFAKIIPFSGPKKDFTFREARKPLAFLKKLKPLSINTKVDLLAELYEAREERDRLS